MYNAFFLKSKRVQRIHVSICTFWLNLLFLITLYIIIKLYDLDNAFLYINIKIIFVHWNMALLYKLLRTFPYMYKTMSFATLEPGQAIDWWPARLQVRDCDENARLWNLKNKERKDLWIFFQVETVPNSVSMREKNARVANSCGHEQKYGYGSNIWIEMNTKHSLLNEKFNGCRHGRVPWKTSTDYASRNIWKAAWNDNWRFRTKQ